MKVIQGVYRAVTMVALPLASLYLTWRSRRQPAYREFWDERFAWSTYPLRGDRPRVWIHAVSVGETNAVEPLLRRMLAAWPDCDVLLTHMTPTGRETGGRLVRMAPDRIHQCYLPYDAPYAVERFFQQTRPTLGIVMETEVWPNVMAEAKRLGIPMVLANARESEKSRRQAARWIQLMGPAFASFSAVLAQSAEDEARLRSLGAQNITVCGSIKFDIEPDPSQRAAAKDWKARLVKPVALLASTRQGEEWLFAEALKGRPELLKRVHLLVVPRHPQRFDEAARVFSERGFSVVRRSQITDPLKIRGDVDVILGDSMGEMSFYCALADMTAMGGSFGDFGSQNVIEPAMAGSPVVVGPSTFNFDEIVKNGVECGAMRRVRDAGEALALFEHWLEHPGERRAAGAAALDFSGRWSGAAGRMMNILEALWQSARKTESRTY